MVYIFQKNLSEGRLFRTGEYKFCWCCLQSKADFSFSERYFMHLIIKGGVQSKSHCKYQFIIMCSTFGSYFSVFHATCIGLHSAFEKYGKDKLDSRGQPYDYGSIMHYPWNAFSTNGRNTLVPKRKVYQQPYRVLSKSDAIQAKLVYNCAGNWKLVDACFICFEFLSYTWRSCVFTRIARCIIILRH